ncbi:T9SS type A sorting domain-containing protein [Fulvivirga lutea]|uniref:T9SS type A sorting domain-containing protein n=1 Tax=Fulvivirga lutea TaxID=2810512 RepID=A0A975A0H2_9BACT|nr:T9SS type A sorting domain-containing protein [Fulvivirga lutea]QSE97180.1 T9SS type A sorting domain-containing protein [Fulvivirga lutea]
MTKFLVVITCLLAINTAYSQEVIATAGEESINSTGVVNFTIGEVFTANYLNVSEGFHQPQLTVVTNINNLTEKSGFQVYPNPVNSNLTINANKESIRKAIVVDMHGKVLHQTTFFQNTSIDFNSYGAGFYIIMIQEKNKTTKFKVFKQ